MLYFTEIEGVPIFDVFGEFVGRMREICIDPKDEPNRVAFYLAKSVLGGWVTIPYSQVQSFSHQAIHIKLAVADLPADAPDEAWIWAKKDLLDQQIIDVNDRKVVRVNDLDFDVQPADGYTELRVVAVNVGLAAAARRLLQGLLPKHWIRSLEGWLPSKTIPWQFVNLIESDPARQWKLRISYERLAKMHPADLAYILEHLSAQDQKAVLTSLDEETAAEALSEIPTRKQAHIVEGLDPHKAAHLIEEMPPDEAADLLQELPTETSTELLADMEKDEAEDVQELLQFEEGEAGALMTKDFISLPESATVAHAVRAVAEFEGQIETLHTLYRVDAQEKLVGAVSLARIAVSPGSKHLSELSAETLLSASGHDPQERVIELFQKYNLLSLPILDEEKRLIGEVTADDVIDLVVTGR